MANQQQQFILHVLAYAAGRNADPEAVCRLSGLDFTELQQQDVIIQPDQAARLWEVLRDTTGDELIGLHIGESMQLAALGVVGGVIQHSRTVGEALTHAAQLLPLLTDLLQMEITWEGHSFTVAFIPTAGKAEKWPVAVRQLAELCMVLTMYETDGLVMEKIKPLAVCMPHRPGAHAAEYARVLRCTNVHTGGNYTLELEHRFRDMPVISANYELQAILLKKAQEMSAAVVHPHSMKEKIVRYLSGHAYLGIPSVEELAANFAMSPRSLQRRLQEEGVTYQQLADEIRKTLALHYLQSGSYPVKEISYMLGYNESSAFVRAFRRWTGTTPMGYAMSGN